jgi:protein gp37
MSKIEWTEQSWNPIVGCSKVSAGCKYCYAETIANRMVKGLATGEVAKKYEGTTYENGHWSGQLNFDEKTLLLPLKRKKPTMYFVNSMSDLFHENVPFEWIDKIFAIMALCPQHTFQILTKRSEIMKEYFERIKKQEVSNIFQTENNVMQGFIDKKSVALMKISNIDDGKYISEQICSNQEKWNFLRVSGSLHFDNYYPSKATDTYVFLPIFPLPNVWLGVSVENQKTIDRVFDLLQVPAAVRFVSAEPLLENIDFTNVQNEELNVSSNLLAGNWTGNDEGLIAKLDWVIVGGESGHGARHCKLEWIENIVTQCQTNKVPVFVKQLGTVLGKKLGVDHKDISQFPKSLQVREYPKLS